MIPSCLALKQSSGVLIRCLTYPKYSLSSVVAHTHICAYTNMYHSSVDDATHCQAVHDLAAINNNFGISTGSEGENGKGGIKTSPAFIPAHSWHACFPVANHLKDNYKQMNKKHLHICIHVYMCVHIHTSENQSNHEQAKNTE